MCMELSCTLLKPLNEAQTAPHSAAKFVLHCWNCSHTKNTYPINKVDFILIYRQNKAISISPLLGHGPVTFAV